MNKQLYFFRKFLWTLSIEQALTWTFPPKIFATDSEHNGKVGLFVFLGPEPAFGRLGLGGSSGEFSSHRHTFHASLCAYGAQLGGIRLSSRKLSKDVEDLVLD